jgi:hypothetical protein
MAEILTSTPRRDATSSQRLRNEEQIDKLQAELREQQIEATVCDISGITVTVSAHAYPDYLFARSFLNSRGFEVRQPGRREL